jgi:hypothetical protein
MSDLAKRLIGEGKHKHDEERTYTIRARPEHLDDIERFFAWINSTRSGHSGSAQIFVDGDGSARVEITKKDGELPDIKDEQISTSKQPEFKVCLESSTSKDVPMLVVEATRPQKYDVCPHCQQEIFERHTYIEGDFMSGNYTERHSGCKGAIKWPEQPLDNVVSWLRPYVEKTRALRQSL